jgi:hypothetical protein
LSAQSQALRDALQARLAELGSGPTKIQGQSYEALRAARQAELGAKYGAERSKLEEELAARGLSASTIGGGRYGDLAGQQARALGTLDAELLGQQAEAEARDRAQYLNTMQQFAQTTGTQDIGTFEANVRSKEVTATINLRAAELQQRAALEGRSLDLQQARDQATSEYQMGQLALSTDELGETRRRNLAGESQATLELAERKRSGLAGEKLQGDQQAEDKRKNDLLDKVQQGQLTLQQGIAVNQLLSDIYAGRVPAEAWEATLRALGLKPADFVSLKPAAKEDKAATDKAKEDKAKEDKAKEDKAAEDKAAEDKQREADEALAAAKRGSGTPGGPGGLTGRPNRPGAFDNEVVGNYRWNAGDYQWEQYTGF